MFNVQRLILNSRLQTEIPAGTFGLTQDAYQPRTRRLSASPRLRLRSSRFRRMTPGSQRCFAICLPKEPLSASVLARP